MTYFFKYHIWSKIGHSWVMSSKPLKVRVSINELPILVEKKSKQTDLNDTPNRCHYPLMIYLNLE